MALLWRKYVTKEGINYLVHSGISIQYNYIGNYEDNNNEKYFHLVINDIIVAILNKEDNIIMNDKIDKEV